MGKKSGPDYEAICKEAERAAEAAAREKLAELLAKPQHPSGMLSECGGAHIRVKDGRTAFARWAVKNGRADREGGSGTYLSLKRGHNRQDYLIDEAAARAAAEVLERHGIEVWVNVYLT